MNQNIIYCAKCGSRLDEHSGFCATCASSETKTPDNTLIKMELADDETATAVLNAVDGIVTGKTHVGSHNAGNLHHNGAVGDPRYNAAISARAASIAAESSHTNAIAKNVPVEKPKGFKEKFKALPRQAKSAIIFSIVILSLLLIVGIITLVNHALSLSPPVQERPTPEAPAEPIPGGVQSVRLTHNGAFFADGVIEVGESFSLRVEIEPDDIDDEVVWTNQNTSVIEVTYNNEKRTDVTVTGIGRGFVRLTARVGGVEAACVFRVQEGPPPEAESVVITSEGEPIEQADLYVGDSIILRILIEPEGVVDEITFTSSNPGVLEAIPSNLYENEIIVKGVSEGSATLTVSVGSVSVECVFTTEVKLVEVPHPYAVGLQEFFRGSYTSTAAYISDVPGADEPVVLAARFVNEHEPTYRVMYMRDGNLRTHDFYNLIWPMSRALFSETNHLATVFSDDGIWFNVHLFEDGELKIDAVKLWTEYDPEYFDGFWHNDRQVTEAEFDALLGVYGLNSDNIWADRSDDTAVILTMTIMAPAT